MGGEHTEGERVTRPERGSAIKGNSVGGAFALPTSPSSFSKKEKGKKEKKDLKSGKKAGRGSLFRL